MAEEAPSEQTQPGVAKQPLSPDGPILDELTRVYSIQYFEHQMRSEMAYSLRHRMPMSLVLVAVDHLDDLIESFGREARDRILQRVADEVLEHVRTEDVMARYGMGMFAVLVRGTAVQPAGFLARRIRQSVESASLTHEGMELPVTVSIGVATLSSSDEEHGQVVQNAERALEQARAACNCVVVDE